MIVSFTNLSEIFKRIPRSSKEARNLQPVLRTWQIFFIALTAVIGTGAFNDFARASATVGPAGTLVAIVVVGLVAASFMEALSEMLQIFRTVNPLVEYVHVFVDPALAKCVAGVYWFSYASFMAVQLVGAASYASDMTRLDHALIFFIAFPAIFTGINLLPVQWYAWLETFFGGLKLLLVLALTMILFYVAGNERGAENITQGFRPGRALCVVLEYVAFSFLGIESIAVMSYEAKDKSALKNSSQIIAWVPMMFYLLFAISMNMCFDWNADDLAIKPLGVDAVMSPTQTKYSQDSAVLLAAEKLQLQGDAFTISLKAILMVCALSAANTTLYIASRMLLGSAKGPEPRRILHNFSRVSSWGIPVIAVLFTALSFCLWLPFTSLARTPTSAEVIDFFGFAGSVGVLFVWGTTCLAYLRYFYWFWLHRDDLQDQSELRKFNRFSRHHSKFFTPTAYFHLQPLTTAIGLVGCIFLVFVCPGAQWWGDPSAGNFFKSYLLHAVVFIAWVAMKVGEFFHRKNDEGFRLWVKIERNQRKLRKALRDFKYVEIRGKEEHVDDEMQHLTGQESLEDLPQG